MWITFNISAAMMHEAAESRCAPFVATQQLHHSLKNRKSARLECLMSNSTKPIKFSTHPRHVGKIISANQITMLNTAIDCCVFYTDHYSIKFACCLLEAQSLSVGRPKSSCASFQGSGYALQRAFALTTR